MRYSCPLSVQHRYAVFFTILLVSTVLSFTGFVSVARADPASYTVQAQEKDGTWTPGVVSGYVGCENVPFRLIATYGNPDQGDTFTITLLGESIDTAATPNRGIDYLANFAYSDPDNIIDIAPTVDGHSLPWVGGAGTGTLQAKANGVQDLVYTLTFKLISSYSGNHEITFTWGSHLALSPNGAAEWIGPPTGNIQSGASPPSGGTKTVNIQKPVNMIATTTRTISTTTTSTDSLTTDTVITTSSISETTETSITNPTTTRETVMTSSCGVPTTYTYEQTYTTSFITWTQSSQVGEETSETRGLVTVSSLVTVTTTSTTFYTTIGSTTGGTVYQTVVTEYYVRESWLETVINGLTTWIINIYNLVFGVKVDPTVDRTAVIVEECTGTAETTNPQRGPSGLQHVGGEMFTANKLAVLSPYLALIGLAAVAVIFKRRRT